MSQLVLSFKDNTPFRVDMRWLSRALEDPAISDLSEVLVPIDSKGVAAGDLFSIQGATDAKEIIVKNSTPSLDYLGHRLGQGYRLEIEGDSGFYTAANLSGGHVIANGNTSDYSACSMSAGLFEINGNCGDYLGSAESGEKRGMSGGSVLVRGSTGHFTGDMMRRGMILVEEDIGDYCASRMIAGTIAAQGEVGRFAGQNMKRGTLLFPHKPETMLPTFTENGRHNLGYLTLLLREILRFDSKFRKLHIARRRVQRYVGDRAVGGQGELLVWIGGGKIK